MRNQMASKAKLPSLVWRLAEVGRRVAEIVSDPIASFELYLADRAANDAEWRMAA